MNNSFPARSAQIHVHFSASAVANISISAPQSGEVSAPYLARTFSFSGAANV